MHSFISLVREGLLFSSITECVSFPSSAFRNYSSLRFLTPSGLPRDAFGLFCLTFSTNSCPLVPFSILSSFSPSPTKHGEVCTQVPSFWNNAFPQNFALVANYWPAAIYLKGGAFSVYTVIVQFTRSFRV